MLLLIGVSDKIQLVTLAGVTIDVHVSYVDKTGTTVTPGRKNTAITTATTTDICLSPPAGTERNVQTIQIRNKDVSACDIVVQHTDGVTASEMLGVNLSAGWEAEYIDGYGWKVIDASGMVLSGSLVAGGGGIALRGSGTFMQSTGTVQFQNSNGITFGLTGGAMTASHNGLTIQSVQPGLQSLSGGTTRITTGEVVFSNSNGISAGVNGQTVTFSHNAITTARASNDGIGLNTAHTNVTWTANSSGLSFNAAGYAGTGTSATNATVTLNSQGLQINVAAPGAISAGTQSVNTGTVVFSNSNGITFGMSGSSRITASHNGLTTAAQSDHTHGTVAFFGTNASATFDSTSSGLSVSISVAAPGAGGGVAISASDSLYTSGTVLFTGSNNITVSRSGAGQTVIISGPNTHAQQTGISGIAGSGASTVTAGTVQFSNANGISFGLNGSTMTASHNALTSQSNQAFSASGGSSAFQTIEFQASNGITFSNNAGSVRVTHGLQFSSNTTDIITGRAGTGTTFAGANISASMTLNTAGLNMSASVAAPGAGGGFTLQGSGTYNQGTGTISFANSNRVTFGLSTNQMTASIDAAGTGTTFAGANLSGSMTLNSGGLNLSMSAAAPGGGAAVTHNFFAPYDEALNVAGQHGQGTLIIRPDIFPNVALDQLCFRVIQTAQTGQTGTATLSLGFGLYTKNASTLSLYASTTGTLTVPFSGTASNATYAGHKLATIGWTTTITEGVYWVAIASSTATAGGNCSISQFLKSQMASTFSGIWGAASNATMQRMLGQGRFTAATLQPPNSIAFSAIQGNSSLFHRPPIFFMISGTV